MWLECVSPSRVLYLDTQCTEKSSCKAKVLVLNEDAVKHEEIVAAANLSPL